MVLKLRQAGLTQEDIARRMKTTRANISLIEKRARENIERSRETLKEWSSIISPVRIIVKRGTDVMEIPDIVFAESDKSNIHVKTDSLDLITRIKKEKGSLIANRILMDDLEIDINVTGEVTII